MRNLLILSLIALPTAGCAAIAAVGTGVVVASNYGDNNVYVSTVRAAAKVVWAEAKEFLAQGSKELIEYDDQTRIAKAKIDDARVTVQVEAWDVDQARMTVSAKQFFATVNDGEMAKIVTERLLRRLEK